jgi:radical SAM protein with 4Fe4S-binding SPASM domain
MFDTSRRPLVPVCEVTQACDLACDHCRGDAEPGRHPDELSTVEGRALVERYRESALLSALRDRSNLTGRCRACPYRKRCGRCRSRAYAHTGDQFGSDPLCPYVPAEWEPDDAAGSAAD